MAAILLTLWSSDSLQSFFRQFIFTEPLREIPNDWDHYRVLGVRKFESDEDTLKRGYRKRVLEWHPDRSRADTTGLLQRATEALEVLTDAERRERYDLQLRTEDTRRRHEVARQHPLDWSLQNPLVLSVTSSLSFANAFLLLLALSLLSWTLETAIPLLGRLVLWPITLARTDESVEVEARMRREAALRDAREKQQARYRARVLEEQRRGRRVKR